MQSRFMGWTFDQFAEKLQSDLPLLAQFSATEQDAGWHGEGNVAVHTNLVLQETYALIVGDASHLSVEQQDVLILSALLHDYGKPLTTRRREKDGMERVVAPHHELMGASLLFSCYPIFHLTASQWQQVIQLVAYHDQPKKLVYMNKSEADYRALSRTIPSMELIYLLEVADRRGTVSDDYEKQLEMLEVFKLFSQELGIWQLPAYQGLRTRIATHFDGEEPLFIDAAYHKGMDALDRGEIYQEDEVMALAYGNKGKSHVIIMCAISGSGKSTYIEQHLPGYVHISPDEIRETVIKNRADVKHHGQAFAQAHEQMKVALREGKNVVWDATNTRIDFRSKIVSAAKKYGAYVEIVLIQSALHRSLRNNQQRKHRIPDEIIRRQAQKFQLPQLSEAHRLTWIA